MSDKDWVEKKPEKLETQIANDLSKIKSRYARLEAAILNLKPDSS